MQKFINKQKSFGFIKILQELYMMQKNMIIYFFFINNIIFVLKKEQSSKVKKIVDLLSKMFAIEIIKELK